MDLEPEPLEIGEVDVVLDVIGGEVLERSAALVRPGGTLVTIAEPPTMQPETDGRSSSSSNPIARSSRNWR